MYTGTERHDNMTSQLRLDESVFIGKETTYSESNLVRENEKSKVLGSDISESWNNTGKYKIREMGVVRDKLLRSWVQSSLLKKTCGGSKGRSVEYGSCEVINIALDLDPARSLGFHWEKRSSRVKMTLEERTVESIIPMCVACRWCGYNKS